MWKELTSYKNAVLIGPVTCYQCTLPKHNRSQKLDDWSMFQMKLYQSTNIWLYSHYNPIACFGRNFVFLTFLPSANAAYFVADNLMIYYHDSVMIWKFRAAVILSVGDISHPLYSTHDHMGYWSENKNSFTPVLPLHCTLASTKFPDIRLTE